MEEQNCSDGSNWFYTILGLNKIAPYGFKYGFKGQKSWKSADLIILRLEIKFLKNIFSVVMHIDRIRCRESTKALVSMSN